MGERKEPAAKGSTATLASRVLWLVENGDELEFDTRPGPAGQWYFADWLSDRAVRRMSSPARGVHMDAMSYAWGDQVPGSLPAGPGELLMGAKGIPADQEAGVEAEVMLAWEEIDGRLWQRGLLKTYLSQVWARLDGFEGAYKRHKKEKGLADIEKTRLALTNKALHAPQVPPKCPPGGADVGTGCSSSSSSSASSTSSEDPPAPRADGEPVFDCKDGKRSLTTEELAELEIVMAELDLPVDLLPGWLCDVAECFRNPGGCRPIHKAKLLAHLESKLRKRPPQAPDPAGAISDSEWALDWMKRLRPDDDPPWTGSDRGWFAGWLRRYRDAGKTRADLDRDLDAIAAGYSSYPTGYWTQLLRGAQARDKLGDLAGHLGKRSGRSFDERAEEHRQAKLLAPATVDDAADLDIPGRLQRLAAAIPPGLNGVPVLTTLAGDPGEIEAELEQADRKLQIAAWSAMDEKQRHKLEERRDQALEQHRARMTTDQLEAEGRRVMARLVRDAAGLPVLSLWSAAAEGEA